MKKMIIHPSLFAYEFVELPPYKTYVYALQKGDRVYIIDTFCGSTFMDIIKADFPKKYFIVINTHYHFDHIWGNYSFSDCPIYAHQLCKIMIQRHGTRELQEQNIYFQGTQKLIPPNHCFDGKQLMMEDNLQLLYTPGHTLDGISVYDQMQEALFVGDTLEKPLVQLEEANLPEYKQTLEYFLTLPVVHFYAGHTLHLTKPDVIDTLAYINALLANEAMQFDSDEIQHIHTMNQNAIKR